MKQVNKEKITDFKNLNGGLEILVQLAEKGEIDPWDIDIIEITDKYLMALDKTPRENLLNAGRAIFFASVLLRLKSDILLNISNETLQASQQAENFFPEDELLFQENGPRLDISRLESYLIRSSLCKQPRKKKISLEDLIIALKQAEEEEERRVLRAKLRAEKAYKIAETQSPEDFLEIAHEEDIEQIAQKIEAIIQEHLTTEEKPITLSFLIDILNDKLNPFLALLFLAHLQKIVLHQKEMYGEVYIYKKGTVIQDDTETKKQESKEVKKKGIIDKLKEKIIGKRKRKPKKVIEVISNNNNEVVDLHVIRKLPESGSEIINNGNDITNSR